MQIHGYECVTPFATAGSGNARWCVAQKNGQRFFVKQFLAPVQPVQKTEEPSELLLKRRQRCALFEQKKSALYQAMKQLHSDCIVHVADFFVHKGHYFAVSEYMDPAYPTFESIHTMESKTVKRLLLTLVQTLQGLHAAGIVHADLKPEHILIDNRIGKNHVRLIDFDSGFMLASPPNPKSNIEVDPVYMAPETYRLMIGEPVTLDAKLDTFALGMILHQALTGTLPAFDHNQYTYLYACILDRGKYNLSDQLPASYRRLIRRMLQKNPAKRPGDSTICAALQALV